MHDDYSYEFSRRYLLIRCAVTLPSKRFALAAEQVLGTRRGVGAVVSHCTTERCISWQRIQINEQPSMFVTSCLRPAIWCTGRVRCLTSYKFYTHLRSRHHGSQGSIDRPRCHGWWNSSCCWDTAMTHIGRCQLRKAITHNGVRK